MLFCFGMPLHFILDGVPSDVAPTAADAVFTTACQDLVSQDVGNEGYGWFADACRGGDYSRRLHWDGLSFEIVGSMDGTEPNAVKPEINKHRAAFPCLKGHKD